MIKIINYGSGNVQAIANIYKRLNINYSIADKPEDLHSATKMILPGVGAFDYTMSQLIESGFKKQLNSLVLKKKIPILGICVGMQIMAKKSEEGKLEGLNWISATVKKIDTADFTHKPYWPHMGWNSITSPVKHNLLKNINKERGFYFLHTYYFSPDHDSNILTQTNYGKTFVSAVYKDTIYGVQFHPEKSHNNGIELFRNFAML